MIAKGQLKPGQRVFEKDICKIQGVSRIPVREALRLLQAQGVVRTEPNRGTYVTEFTPDVMIEMLQLRLAVERIALRRMLDRGTPGGDITAQFSDVKIAMRRAATLHDRLAFCQADLAFHHRLVELSASPVLAPTWELLSRGVLIFLMQEEESPVDFEESIEEHEKILELLQAGKKDALDAEIEGHIFCIVRERKRRIRVAEGVRTA